MRRFWLLLNLFLLPLIFVGGCVGSTPFMWSWLENRYVVPVSDNEEHFPVLVVDSSGSYAAEFLTDLPAGSEIVVHEFDESKINSDLNRSIERISNHRYFHVIKRSPNVTAVTLEYPTPNDSKLQGWYDIQQGKIVPTRILHYGPDLRLS